MGGKYGNRRAIAPEREGDVIDLYLQKRSTREVAESFGVSDETIRRILKRNGVPRRKPSTKKKTGCRCPPKGIDRAKVCEMYEGGHSTSDIAQQFGCSQTTIYYHLEKAGLYKIGERKERNEALAPKIVELHEQGMSDCEIANELNVGRYFVNKRLRKVVGYRGKGSNSRNGGIAYAKVQREKAVERFDAISDVVELVEYVDSYHATVKCKKCGAEFNWYADCWDMDEPCPTCRERQLEQARAERERKQYEQQQQREAAREWRLSVPFICKECGEPFYSEYESAVYCCNACRKRASNHRKRRRLCKSSNPYKRRMRIKVTRLTYDRTVTLDAVYKKYRGKCCGCGCQTVRSTGYDPKQATLDHIIALANNGTHTWDNVQLLCSKCNSYKRDTGQMRLAIA